MTDTPDLLRQHWPLLVYDSQEAYFTDSAAIWTDSPTNVLKRADGTVIAKPPTLSLDFLTAGTYPNGQKVQATDTIGETTRDYAAHAKAMHAKPGYANTIYGHSAKDSTGQTWLQYWFFSYYDDFQLLGPLTAGNHEGDWEMIQIRLTAANAPVQAVYAQHQHAEARDWKDVKTRGQQPFVYVARGSHASYFETGSHWTGVWWDHNDGKGQTPTGTLQPLTNTTPAWITWPGWWGDTKATASPIDANSPVGPARHAQWADPAKLVAAATNRQASLPTMPPLPAPTFTATRHGEQLRIAYHAPMTPKAIVVAVRDRSADQQPPELHRFLRDTATGEVEVAARSDRSHDVSLSAVAPDGNTTPTALEQIRPA